MGVSAMLDSLRSLRGEIVYVGVRMQVLVYVRTKWSLEDHWLFHAQVLMGGRVVGTCPPMLGRLSEDRCVSVAVQTNKRHRGMWTYVTMT